MVRVVVLLVVALAASACGSTEPLTLPTPVTSEARADAPERETSPAGSVVVAYSDVPLTWLGGLGDDPAATDLQAVWGLPLYRIGPDGLPRPALVADARTAREGQRFAVTLELRSGRWSDGSPVRAADVVATLEALREEGRAEALAPLAGIAAMGERTVVLRFDRPYAPWRELLADLPGVLPAAVLAADGLAAYDDDIPVSGGWFRLEEQTPGLGARFVAHPDGPLGAPGLAEVEVLFTPRYETALGLIDDGRADVALGHLALNPVARASALEGDVHAAAPIGGTLVALEWRPGGALGGSEDAPARRAVGRAADLSEFVEGLLGDHGELASSPWRGIEGPFEAGDAPPPAAQDLPSLRLLAPRMHEITAFSTRALRRALSRMSVDLELTSLDTPEFVAEAGRVPDGVLRIRRPSPRAPLAEMVGQVTDAVRDADAAPASDHAAIAAGFAEVAAEAYVWPLYRPAVAHVWSDGVVGVRPSAWPALGLWNVGEWSVAP